MGVEDLDLIASCGSLGQLGLKAGAYAVDEPLLKAYRASDGTHPAILGAVIANELVKANPKIRAYLRRRRNKRGRPDGCRHGAS